VLHAAIDNAMAPMIAGIASRVRPGLSRVADINFSLSPIARVAHASEYPPERRISQYGVPRRPSRSCRGAAE
jgi:hypothetical protein